MLLLSPSQQCPSTEGKSITFQGLACPRLTSGLQILSLTTKGFWLPWGRRVANPVISRLMQVHWFSLCINGHFPGECGLAGVYWSKGWWKWWWQLELQVVQSSSQIITTNTPTPNLSQAGCPSCCPTDSVKALKKKYHIPWTCLLQVHWLYVYNGPITSCQTNIGSENDITI